MRRRIWIPILIVGGLVAAFLILRPARPEPESAVERTATIETGPLQVWVTGTGKVEPSAQAALSFKTSGTLGELAATVGETVQSGQVLALLDASSLSASLLGAEADLIAAQQALDDLLEGSSEKQLAQAVMALAQARDDVRAAEYKWNSQQEGMRANSDTVRGAEARLTLAQANVDQAEAAYDTQSPADLRTTRRKH